jgi:hypothetical protein
MVHEKKLSSEIYFPLESHLDDLWIGIVGTIIFDVKAMIAKPAD